MARRGNFGRSPRPAASLQNTIISIAREMQNQRDQNVMDAWQKGGLFEGKKATDEFVLNYWKQRAGSVSKDDPLYDTYHNAQTELDYSIHESKVRTLYAQGKMSDSQTAAFYLNWSKKVPRNSEFYRVLQRDAAQFTAAAKAKSDAEAKRLAEIKYNNDQKSLYDKHVAAGDYILDTLKQLGQRGFMQGGGNQPIDPMTGQLYQIDASGVQDMLRMIFRANDHEDAVRGKAGSVESPTNRALYYGDDGKAVTGASFLQKLQSFGYKGDTINLNDFNSFLVDQRKGLQQMEHLAETTGHNTDATKYANALHVNSELGREVQAWPVEQSYLDARQVELRTLNDPKSSAADIKDAVDKYRATLGKLTLDPRVTKDAVFINKLKGEINGDDSTTTLAEDFTGLNQKQPKEVAGTNVAYDRATSGLDAVASGQAQWTTGEWSTSTGQFTPSPGGSTVGPATTQQIDAARNGINTTVIPTTDKFGRITQVTVLGQEVVTHSFGPDGTELPVQPGTNPVVAHIYQTADGRQQVSYSDSKGKTLWSDVSNAPWGSDARLKETANGFELIITPPTNAADLTSRGYIVTPGKAGKPPTVSYNPQNAMLGTDQARATVIASGGNPTTDFRSPVMSYYTATTEGQHALPNIMNDASIKALVVNQSQQSLGGTPVRDPKTGEVIGYQGYDEAQFGRATNQNAAMANGSTPNEAVMANLYDKTTPAADLRPAAGADLPHGSPSPYYNGVQWNPATADLSQAGITPAAPLATSQLAGQSPLGQTFDHGTLNMAQITPAKTGTSINIGGTSIKVPTYEAPTFKPTATPVVNAQTGFTMNAAPVMPTYQPPIIPHPYNDNGSGK